ncbi:MAG: EAL domain-containing protein [Spirochaetia bacterium]
MPASSLLSLGSFSTFISFSIGAALLVCLLYMLYTLGAKRVNSRFFEFLFNHSFDIFIMMDSNKRVLRVNDAACDALGYTRSEMEGMPAEKLQKREAFSKLYSLFKESCCTADTSKKVYAGDTHLIKKDGTLLPVEAGGSSFIMNNKTYFLGSFRDLTERKELDLTEKIFRHTLEGIVITDTEGIIRRVNPSFTDITGYTSEEVIGKKPRILKSEHHDHEFYRNLWNSLLTEGSWEGEIWNRKKSGEAYPEWLSISSLRNSDGSIRNFVAVFHDISEKKYQEQKLKKLAYHDGLTDLPNRKLFMDRMSMAIATSFRDKNLTALLFIDIDNFKNINATIGHPAGDQLLIKVKEKILDICRDEDTLARYGGDEFVLLLPGLKNSQSVTSVAHRILKLFKAPFTVQNSEHYISVSIGIALYPEDGEDETTLLKNADLALYNAKGLGKNTFAFFKESLNRKMVRRNQLETELRKALEENSFLLYFQPKVDIEKGKVVSMEALIRWRIPEGEWIPPDEFIPIAEQSDLILPLGSWVFRTAMEFLQHIRRLGYKDITMAVNISPKQFLTSGFIDEIETVVNELDIPRSMVILEITEHILMHNVSYSIEVLNTLRNLGFKISIDDFGTGYSSLSYLKEFPVSELKIDRSFIKDLPDNKHASAITRSLIAVASTLGYSIVAEGVETEEHAEFLRHHKCGIAQGYLYSKPLPKNEMIDFIEKIHLRGLLQVKHA